MAQKTIVVSDIGGAELSDDTHARIIVNDHPNLRGRSVALDVSTAEAERLQPGTIALVSMEVYEPNRPMRRVVIDQGSLNKLFKGIDEVIANASPVDEVRPSARSRATSPRATRKATARRSPVSGRKDYASPEWAGVLHRGRVTEAEAEWVRDNLKKANENREREGQLPIDPESEADQKRYFS